MSDKNMSADLEARLGYKKTNFYEKADEAAVKAAYDLAAGKTAVSTATGTIGTSATSATVNYTGTLINAYATMGGALVMLDIAPGSGSVVFSTAEAPSAAVTCVVVYV